MSHQVAVITRTKNRPLLLPRAMESVLRQTFADWVHVIVNDGGDPAVVEALLHLNRDRYAGRLQVMHVPNSVGMQNASNIGIRCSDSAYLCIHDDDDAWASDFLARTVGVLERLGEQNACQGVICQSWLVSEVIDSLGNVVEIGRQPYGPNAIEHLSLFEMGWKNPFPPIAFIYRRSVHSRIGYFDQRFNVIGDWDFNLRFLREFDIGVLPDRLAHYHLRNTAGKRVDSYGNTVVADVQDHLFFQAHHRNTLLRDQLKEPCKDLGLMVNVAHALGEVKDRAGEVLDVSRGISGKLAILEKSLGRVENQLADRPRARPVLLRRPDRDVDPCVVYRELLAAVDRCSCLSLDVFDTALSRNVENPVDVGMLLEPKLRAVTGLAAFPFENARRHAEERARDAVRAALGGEEAEVHLIDIMRLVAEEAGLDASWAERFVDIEFKLERSLCRAVPVTLAMFRRAKRQGKKVIFSSDTYWSGAQLTELLEACGYAGAEVLASSDASCSKHFGGLYGLVKHRAGCPPPDILHVGDNYHSDVLQAERAGIGAYHYRRSAMGRPFSDQRYIPWEPQHRDILTSVSYGLARRRRQFNPRRLDPRAGEDHLWEDIGYELAGPMALGFLVWVMRHARAENADNVYFLSRDGYHLERIYRRLQAEWHVDIPAHYLFASRRLLNVPGLTTLDTASLNALVVPHPMLRVGDFLERVGLSVAKHAELIRANGFEDPAQVITSPEGYFIDNRDYHRLCSIFRSVADEVLALAASERASLFGYWDAVGFPGQRAMIVDLGWAASSIAALTQLLRIKGVRASVTGLYFATWPTAWGQRDKGCRFHSYYCHIGYPERRVALGSDAVATLESVFSAPHPTVDGLQWEGKQWQPRFVTEPDAGREKRLQTCWAAADAYVADALPFLTGILDSDATGLDYIDNVFQRVFAEPTAREAKRLGALRHTVGFGVQAPAHPIAQAPASPARVSTARLEQAYLLSQWKAGFLAQLDDRQVARLARVLAGDGA